MLRVAYYIVEPTDEPRRARGMFYIIYVVYALGEMPGDLAMVWCESNDCEIVQYITLLGRYGLLPIESLKVLKVKQPVGKHGPTQFKWRELS